MKIQYWCNYEKTTRNPSVIISVNMAMAELFSCFEAQESITGFKLGQGVGTVQKTQKSEFSENITWLCFFVFSDTLCIVTSGSFKFR